MSYFGFTSIHGPVPIKFSKETNFNIHNRSNELNQAFNLQKKLFNSEINESTVTQDSNNYQYNATIYIKYTKLCIKVI